MELILSWKKTYVVLIAMVSVILKKKHYSLGNWIEIMYEFIDDDS